MRKAEQRSIACLQNEASRRRATANCVGATESVHIIRTIVGSRQSRVINVKVSDTYKSGAMQLPSGEPQI